MAVPGQAHTCRAPSLFRCAQLYPDGEPQSTLRNWCDLLTLLGQANYHVVLHDPSTLARCVATLGALLSRGLVRSVTQEDGSSAEGVAGVPRLRDRVCYLKSEQDWECLRDLIKGVETAMKDSREMVVKCHPNFIALKPLQTVLDELAKGERQASNLKAKVRVRLSRPVRIRRCVISGMPRVSFCGVHPARRRFAPLSTSTTRSSAQRSSTRI